MKKSKSTILCNSQMQNEALIITSCLDAAQVLIAGNNMDVALNLIELCSDKAKALNFALDSVHMRGAAQ